MKFNLNDFIDVEKHNQQIDNSVQRIRNQWARTCDTKQYLDSLFNFFLNDIKVSVDDIYKVAFVKMNKVGLKNRLSELKQFFIDEFKKNFFDKYRHYLSDYRSGGFFGDYSGDFKKFIKTFEEKANQNLKEQCNFNDYNYRKELTQNRYNFSTIFISIFVLVFTIIGVILTIFGLSHSNPDPNNTSWINLKCDYKNVISPDTLTKLKKINLENEITDNSKWWRFWDDSTKTISFSINEENNKVLTQLREDDTDVFILADSFSAEIYPDYFILHGYPKGLRYQQNQQEEWTININRINDELSGTKWASDGSLEPYFKKGDIMWSITGRCQPLKKAF